MLRFFRLNDPYRLFVLFFVLVLLALTHFIFQPPLTNEILKSLLIGEEVTEGKLLYVELYDSTAPLSALFFGLVDWLCGRSIMGRQFIALLLIFFQASFFAVVLIRNKAFTDSSYLPALLVGVLSFISFDFLSLSPELLGSTLLLLAISNLFKEIEFKIQRDEITLNLGLYLGLASLFMFSFYIFFIGTVIVLLVFTRINLRKYLLLATGFLLPHIALLLYYFYYDGLDKLFYNFYYPNLTFGGSHLISFSTILVLLAIPLAYLLLAFLKLNNEGRFTKYQNQLSQVMLLWLVFATIQVCLTNSLTPHSFIIFVPSVAYFISHYFLLIKRKWLAEFLLVFLLVGIINVNLLARFNWLPIVSYNNLFVKTTSIKFRDKKLMIVDGDFGLYQYNHFSGYFLDLELAKAVLDEPDYFEHVILMHKLFEVDPPDVIVDPADKLKPFLKRMPDVSLSYRREGDAYFRTNN
jgi:hypothetical protein